MKHYQAEKGFTLLEVVVSLGLLIMVFGSATSLLILTRESEQTSKNNLIAAYLAKEAQDLVRYRRDYNYINLALPFNGLAVEIENGSNNPILIDYTGQIVPATSADVKLVNPLKINDQGFYYHNDAPEAPATIFRRLVTSTYHAASPDLPAYLDVKAEVYWQSDTKKDIYTLESQVFNWH